MTSAAVPIKCNLLRLFMGIDIGPVEDNFHVLDVAAASILRYACVPDTC